MLGLELPRRSQAVNLGWVLLVPGLGPLSKSCGLWGLTEAGWCLFERIKGVVKQEPRAAIHMEKPLLTDWVACQLGGKILRGFQGQAVLFS